MAALVVRRELLLTIGHDPTLALRPGDHAVDRLANLRDREEALRERLFGNWEMNWVGFNYARDFTLPEQKEGPIGFLMYPYAETSDGSKDSLTPETFAYTISSKEI